MDFDNGYIFVIDTRSHAGNFHREICAFMTGECGSSVAGVKEAEEFYKTTGYSRLIGDPNENPLIDLVVSLPLDNECCSEPSFLLGPRNTSAGVFFAVRPSPELLLFLQKRAHEFCKQAKIKIIGFRLLKKQTLYSEEELTYTS